MTTPTPQAFYTFSSENGLTMFLPSGNVLNVKENNPKFKDILEMFKAGKYAEVENLLSPKQQVETFINLTKGQLVFTGNAVLDHEGNTLHGALVDTIIKMAGLGLDPKPLLNFYAKLRNNPSYTAQQELYLWIEAAQMPITPDGDFLAYKKVNANYTSIHDGKTDNSVGSQPSMPRGEVDDNRDRTCSRGLHFCSKGYLPHFGSSDGSKVVLVKINPADVVSIPSDYSNTKGRAWTYKVIEDVTDKVGHEALNRPVFDPNLGWDSPPEDYSYDDDDDADDSDWN